MIKGIYQAGRSLEGKMRSMEVIANNLANLNTTGFKREVPFSEIISQAGQIRIEQVTDFQQGTAAVTGNPLDLYLNGKSFFALQTENGIELTRNGKFKISDDGFLVNEQGYKVLGQNGEINLNETMLNENKTILISKIGELRIGDIPIDTLLVIKIDTNNEIERINGINFMYKNGDYELASLDEYEITQGYLEESNINPIAEMEEMIRTNADYNAASKLVGVMDESLGKANEIGKV
jgi:flagellar basal-body rod protein FlgF